MYTVMQVFRKVIVFSCFISLLMTGKAQQLPSAKNFAGVSGNILWSTTGISWGLSGERILLSKRGKELSLKADYTFRHRFGNLVLFYGPRYDISSTETSLGLQGFIYPGSDKSGYGIFFSAGGGGMSSSWRDTYDHSVSTHYLKPYGELGAGFKWKLEGGMAIRWSNMIKLFTPQPDRDPIQVITSSTLAIGF